MTDEDSLPDWQQLFDQLCPEIPELDPRLVARLPVVSRTVQEFGHVVSEPDVPIEKVAEFISADPAMSTMVLRHANSPRFGDGRIKTIRHAAAMMGMRRLTNAVFSLSFQQAVQVSKSPQICMKQFGVDNRERAAFASHLSRCLGGDAHSVYIAALLQDLLLPVLLDVYPQVYRDVGGGSQRLVQAELEAFGCDHGGIAAATMKEWNFPAELITCVYMHHRFQEVVSNWDAFPAELQAVCTASLLPEQLNQESLGPQQMLVVQEKAQQCNVLEVAAAVDEELDETDSGSTALCARLSRLLTDRLVEDQFHSLLVERTIGRYTLERELGKGGMGVVYRARHQMLRRPAAIKILDTRRLRESDVKRFEAEVQLTCQLSSANTITVYDYGMTPEGFFYYAMEYVDGPTLAQLVSQRGPLPEELVVRILLQVCDSLAEAHTVGLVHRDIKPENLMVQSRAIGGFLLKVVDFGLVAVVSGTGKHKGQLPAEVCGTPGYLASEAIESPTNIDHRVDIYALGAVGYFLLTGRNLFGSSDGDIGRIISRHLTETPERPSAVLQRAVSEDLEDVIMACLAISRDDRPESVFAMAEMLQACASAPEIPAALSLMTERQENLNFSEAPHVPSKSDHLSKTIIGVGAV